MPFSLKRRCEIVVKNGVVVMMCDVEDERC
jgi:hypothetical protein